MTKKPSYRFRKWAIRHGLMEDHRPPGWPYGPYLSGKPCNCWQCGLAEAFLRAASTREAPKP